MLLGSKTLYGCAYREKILFVTFNLVSGNNTWTGINFLFQSFYFCLLRLMVISTNTQMVCSACSRWEVDSAFLTLEHLINCSVHLRAAASWAWDMDLADSGTPLLSHITWISSNSNATYLLWWQLLQYGFPESSPVVTIYII